MKRQHINTSIIIPAYQSQNYIIECIESIINQNIPSQVEILIGIDNCDLTKDVITEWNKDKNLVSMFWFNNNVGPYLIKNTLGNIAQYEYLIFFDSDDIMESKLIESTKECSHRATTTRYKYSSLNETGKDVHVFPCAEGSFGIWKEDFISIGGFLPWRCAADTEFRSRVRRNFSSPEIVINDTMFKYRAHNNSLTMKEETGFNSEIREKYATQIKLLDACKVTTVQFTTTPNFVGLL
ncbi:MAG: glycosyltransferase family A protein [Clostridia bacterium]|jgi:glycosyltransferase involved in cell wall biosynthesis